MVDLLEDSETHEDPLLFLRTFREDEKAYQTLLQAVRFVLHDREISPPFHVVDVFFRHPFFGGNQLPRKLFHCAKQSHRMTRDTVRDSGLVSEKEMDSERDLESRRNELLGMFEEDDNVESPRIRIAQRLMLQFFQFAHASGDMVTCRKPVLFVSSGGYAMTEGGYESQPSLKSKFFAPDYRAQESGKQRRKIVETKHSSC